MVPETYLDRLTPLMQPSSGWFHPAYRGWFDKSVASGAMPVLNFRHGPMTELKLDIGNRLGPTEFAVHAIPAATSAVIMSALATVLTLVGLGKLG